MGASGNRGSVRARKRSIVHSGDEERPRARMKVMQLRRLRHFIASGTILEYFLPSPRTDISYLHGKRNFRSLCLSKAAVPRVKSSTDQCKMHICRSVLALE